MKKIKEPINQSVQTSDEYTALVKNRLIKWKKKFEDEYHAELNFSAIEREMYNRFNIETTTTTLKAMFDETQCTRKIPLRELTALAQMFPIPIWDICAHPNALTSFDIQNLTRRKGKADLSVHQLDNAFYDGDYWCYYFNPKHFEGQLKPVENIQIEEAKLSICIESGRTTVTFEEQKATTTFDGKPMPSFTLSGNLYHFENADIAYSFISDNSNRRAMALMFTYLNLNTDVRYYITAGMMTFSQNQTHKPLFQKVAIFRKRQTYKKEAVANVLRGILSLNSYPIAIERSTCEKMIHNDSSWDTVLTSEKAMAECLVFSEVSVRDALYNITDENQKMEMLLQLRKNSLLPAHEIVSEPDYFADFIRAYQLENIDKFS